LRCRFEQWQLSLEISQPLMELASRIKLTWINLADLDLEGTIARS
jgi:hypothetical protein